ncbi:MAG: shikimate dehydrogenase [Lentisphaerae bacterium RIFOXYC12_FULL_60_16]|nr:MAG: shikimate dehydrogenase [Lentisphaerae bacterium RIFOXYC12_FULL_60_16]OGV86360.1 MAG: shikimate dehydrogenase [Lentisphaerae bacterium RIFOXYB12_FULL_60_10]
MQPGGHTEPFAVLGHPIGHSLSPAMHNAGFEALGMDAIYVAFDVHPDRLMNVLPAMAAMGFRGINLTVPLKETAFRGLRDLTPEAQRLGAVNTVQIQSDGSLRGHNTDGTGFLESVRESFGLSVAGQTVFVLGCGGAGRAVAITCAMAGAARLLLANAHVERAQRVAVEIGTLSPGTPVSVAPSTPSAWISACRESTLVVQSTTVGMKPGDPSLLPPEAFHAGQCAMDLIYHHPETPFTRAAHIGGASTVNGLGMLLHQGTAAFTIWTGKPAATTAMRQALEQAVYTRSPT